MFKSRFVLCLGAFLIAGCSGVATPTTPVSTQQTQEVGAPCDVSDGIDSCNPDVTGLCCCTRGPSIEGFCIDTCPAPCV
jgi:hypothetical protein